MKHISLSLFFLLFAASAALAQSVKGRISDARTGQALPFVNIGVLGKSIGTVADEEGKFRLAVSEGQANDAGTGNAAGSAGKR
jgi:hypothetical protein